MRVLVTGNTGLIGRALVSRLLQVGNFEVTLFRTPEQPRDIRSMQAVVEAMTGADLVFHLVSMLNYRYPTKQDLWDVNVHGTENVLRTADKAGVSQVIVISSQAVYAASPGRPGPMDENAPLKAKDLYGKSKLAAEQVCLRHSQKPKPAVAILRLASVYGHGSISPDSILATFVKSARSLGEVKVFGQGRRIRDLVFIDDVVDALIGVVGHPGIFNVGGGHPYSTKYIAELVCRLVGGRVIYDETKAEDRGFYMDISRLKALIGYNPTPLEVGLKHSLKLTNLSGGKNEGIN